MKNFFANSRRAFTLIELLVVIAIIAILAAILFPVFGRARENAKRSSCLSNIRQLGMAFVQYVQDNDDRFPFNKTNATTGQQSWVVSAQPYLKSQQVLRCPSDDSENWDTAASGSGDFAGVRTTSYTMNLYMVPSATSVKPYSNLAAIQKASKVIMLSEASKNFTGAYFHASVWPGGHWVAATGLPDDIATDRHLGGFNTCYVDGHAKWQKWERVWFAPNGSTPTDEQRGDFFPGQQ